MVSEGQHTPGPWKVDQWVTSRAGTDVLPDYYNRHLGTPVRIASCEDYWVGAEEAKANARLIAAAPDLLAALKGILAITDRNHVAWHAAYAAIAKANGESP